MRSARRHPPRWGLALLGALLALGAPPAAAEEVPVPADLQAQLFVKILSFDRQLRQDAGKDVLVGILVQNEYRASLDAASEMVAAIESLGAPSASEPRLRAVLIELDGGDLAERLGQLGVEALYLTPLRAVSVAAVVTAARRGRIRTLTGVPAYVRHGVAIGLGVREGQPHILVNLAEAEAQGADLSSQLLALAQVMR